MKMAHQTKNPKHTRRQRTTNKGGNVAVLSSKQKVRFDRSCSHKDNDSRRIIIIISLGF